MAPIRILELLILLASLAGFVGLLLRRNLFLKVLSMDVMGSAVVALFVLIAARSGLRSPIGSALAGNGVADPIPQAVILTAIVITMGVAAFVLALIYRSYRLTTQEVVTNDPEDTRVAELADADLDEAEAQWLGVDGVEGVARPDTDAPDELDAVPGAEGSR